MNRAVLKIGILFSTTGSYGAVGSTMRAGADLAISAINADPSAPVTLQPVAIDPGGVIGSYIDATQTLLVDHGLSHVFGCYTSSSRKEVLPYFEKNDAMLWYPSHYEGFETNDNVVYTGAAPNQHIVPLARHLLRHHGNRGWFVGSNYVWAWENNRILREALVGAGGTVLGERYFPVGETDLGELAAQIVRDQPDFVFTTLIGASGYAFFREFRMAAEAAGVDQTQTMPVASCSLSEAELLLMEDFANGHLSSSVYFSTIHSPENDCFTRRWDHAFGHLGRAPADAEATYNAVHLLVAAIEKSGSSRLSEIREALRGLRLPAPQGSVTVDSDNLHCRMRPRIGRSTQQGTFDLLYEAPAPVRPDPYLVWTDLAAADSGRAQGYLRAIR